MIITQKISISSILGVFCIPVALGAFFFDSESRYWYLGDICVGVLICLGVTGGLRGFLKYSAEGETHAISKIFGKRATLVYFRESVRISKAIGVVLAVFGGVAFAFGGYHFIETKRFLDQAMRCRGQVDAIEPSQSLSGTSKIVCISFAEPNGKFHSVRCNVSKSSDYSIGTEVSVMYDPLDPSDFRLSSFWAIWFRAVGGLLASLFFMLNSAFLFFLMPFAIGKFIKRTSPEGE